MEHVAATSIDSTARRISLRKRRGRGKARLQPGLTPMIDVTFLLLLFFLLTMQFRRTEGRLPADLPRPISSAVEAVTPLEPIRVALTAGADGVLAIDVSQTDVGVRSWGELYAALAGLREMFGSDEIPVIVTPGPGVSWSDALNAFNEARRAKFKHITFAGERGGS